MYEVYLDDFLFPVTPGELNIKIKNQNSTVTLMDGGEINLLKRPGLTDVEYKVLLPNKEYNWAVYQNGFKPASYYLERLNSIKAPVDGKPKAVPFVVSRFDIDGSYLYGTSLLVSIEDYSIQETADEGTDVVVSIKLKQYRDYGSKVYKIAKAEDADNTADTSKNNSYSIFQGVKRLADGIKEAVSKIADIIGELGL